MKKILLLGSFLALVFAVAPASASADAIKVNFEPPTYTTGNINGQNGWSKTGAYDVAVDESFGVPGFGTQSLRISNAVTSGSFGDHTYSRSLLEEAGEVNAASSTYSGGTLRNHFEAEFAIRPMQLRQQSGLFMSVSPDRGDGARMSYLGFRDDPTGIRINFFDVQGTGNPANFVETVIATGLSRAQTHTIKLTIDFVEGPSNDVVKVYLNGTLVHTGTTWENYYRYDSESNPTLTNQSRRVDSLLFRVGGAAAPATATHGFLIDNLSLRSGPEGAITWNPNDKASTIVLSPSKLDMGASTKQSAHATARTTLGMSGGKWYWETYVTNGPGHEGNVNLIGVESRDADLGPSGSGGLPGPTGFGWGYGTEIGLFYSGEFTPNPSFPIHSSGLPSAPPLTNGWKRFAYDADAGKLWIGDATGWFGGGDPAAGTNPTATYAARTKPIYAAGSLYNVTADKGYTLNYGTSAFQYAVPAGF